MDTQGSPGGRRNRRSGAGNPPESQPEAVSPDDIELNMDDSNRAGMSASDRRKQNSQRRSAMGDTNPSAAGGAESDEEVDVRKMKVNFDESRQIMEIVEHIEDDYATSKKQMN